jgi:hypothetical protein
MLKRMLAVPVVVAAGLAAAAPAGAADDPGAKASGVDASRGCSS